MASSLGIPRQSAESVYEEFTKKAEARFSGGLLNKQVSERYKRRCEHEFNGVLNTLQVGNDSSIVREQHVSAMRPESWTNNPETIFNEEKQAIAGALQGDFDEFLRVFPGKTFIAFACSSLGITLDRYIDVVCSALRANENEPLFQVGQQLNSCLSNYLPSRGNKE